MIRKSVLIRGRAGQGINFTATLLGQMLSFAGYYVFIYRDYASLIRGGHNFNIVTFSDQPLYSHDEKFEAVINLDRSNQDFRKDLVRKDLVLDEKKVNQDEWPKDIPQNQYQINNFLLGYLAGCWGLPTKFLTQSLRKELKLWQPAAAAVKLGIRQSVLREKLPIYPSHERHLLTGTNGIVIGAISSGLDVYLSYPMTPATGVLIELAKQAKQRKMLVAQIEDEIGVINTALGASYGGAMTMVGTSGGGFALMTEAMSLAGMAEIPLVIYLSQRTGPSTGVPTYNAQGDLNFARFAGHGEFPRVLVAPGDPQEAIDRTMEAFYLAYRYRVPAIVLSDKHLGESYYSLDQITFPRIKPDRFIVERPGANYENYVLTASGVSPRAVPGQGAWARANSYEHGPDGFTVEDSQMVKKMNDKRFRKESGLAKKISNWQPVRSWGRGRNLIIGWGSTQGAIRDSLSELRGWQFLQVSYLAPFPRVEVKKAIDRAERVVLVENNATGLLGQLIALETGCLIKDKILKYDGRPFTSHEIINQIKRIL